MAALTDCVQLALIVGIAILASEAYWLIDIDEDSDYDYGDEDDPFIFDLDTGEDGEGDGEEKPCAPPPQVRNGETRVWGRGLLLEYACSPSYFAVGPTHGACDVTTGQWTIQPPLCVEDRCPKLFAPHKGVVNIDVSGGVATFTCRPGYYLIGSRVLLCEEGRWTGVYPVCVVNPKPASTTPSNVSTTPLATSTPVTEDLSVIDSDESCFHNHVEPPVLENAVVDISYVMNELRGRYVMLATYSCFPGYRLLNESANKLFCRNLQWGAAQNPECVSKNDPCAINNGGCEHVCLPRKNAFACTCHDGYTLGENSKDCVDVDECAIDNGGCQQTCHNTLASFFCSCNQGFTAKGPSCRGESHPDHSPTRPP